MAGKLFTGVVALAVASAAAWWFRDTPVVRDLTQQVRSSSAARWAAEQAAKVVAPLDGAAGTTSAGSPLHKCAGETGVTYTNGRCPPGTRRLDVDGAVTVLPPVRAPAPDVPSPAPAAASGTVRGPLADLVGQPLQGTLKEKQLEGIQ